MASLSEEEKELIAQSLQFYLQQASAQLPPQSVQQLMTVAKGVIGKLDQLDGGGSKAGQPPPGISQEWFDNVCVTCPMLTAAGCSDKITVKFPGKCDPVLKYERNKTLEPKIVDPDKAEF